MGGRRVIICQLSKFLVLSLATLNLAWFSLAIDVVFRKSSSLD